MKPALLRNSPERTLEALYRRHVQDVYRYSRAMLDRQADAEDVTQTTFMNAYRALRRGERPRDAASWLRAIALNACREHHRRAGRRPDEVSLEDDPGDLVLDPQVPEIGDVVRGLSALPFNQRAALVMREFEGRSLSEISAALKVSPSAVEALLFRGRRSLREQLEEKLTCGEAERAISRQLDGALPRSERGPLRAHLRECPECASLARRLRAQRSAIRSLALLPLPASLKLGKLAGGGAAPASAAAASGSILPAGGSMLATVTGSLAGKVAVAAVAGAMVAGAGYVAIPHGSASSGGSPHRTAAVTPRTATSTAATTRSRPGSRASVTTSESHPVRRSKKAIGASGSKSTRSAGHGHRPRGARGHDTGVSTGSPASQSAGRAAPGHSASGHTHHGLGRSTSTPHVGPPAPKPGRRIAHAYGKSTPKPAGGKPLGLEPAGPPATPPGLDEGRGKALGLTKK